MPLTGVGAVATFTSALFQGIPEDLIPQAIEKYLGGTDDPVKKKDLFLDIIGDLVFGVPSVAVARYHRGESQRLDRRGTLSPVASLSALLQLIFFRHPVARNLGPFCQDYYRFYQCCSFILYLSLFNKQKELFSI